MGDTGVRHMIISEPEVAYPGFYTGGTNVALVRTHQHSGVGGYLEYLLPQVTALGYVNQSAQTIIQGTLLAMQRAHEDLSPSQLSVSNAAIVDGNINRSPFVYLANPADERARYEFDQDKEMTLVQFDDTLGTRGDS